MTVTATILQRLRCQRKEPCRLFTVRKRQEMVDEVNTNALCQCSTEHACPSHHTDAGVIQSKNYSEENIRTYSGYCMSPSLSPSASPPSPPSSPSSLLSSLFPSSHGGGQ